MSVFQYSYQICNMFYDCYLGNKKFQINHHLHCYSCFDITCPLYKSIPCFLALTSHILFVSLYSYALRKNNKFFLLILCNMRKLILILVTAEIFFADAFLLAWRDTKRKNCNTQPMNKLQNTELEI